MTTPAVWAHRRFVYNSAVDWLGGIGRTDLTHPDSGLTSEDVLAAAYDLGWSPLSARFVVEPDADAPTSWLVYDVAHQRVARDETGGRCRFVTRALAAAFAEALNEEAAS